MLWLIVKSASIPLSLSGSLWCFHSLSLALSLSLSLSLSLDPSISLPLYFTLSLCKSLSVLPPLFLCNSFSFSPSSASFCLSLSIYLSPPPVLFWSQMFWRSTSGGERSLARGERALSVRCRPAQGRTASLTSAPASVTQRRAQRRAPWTRRTPQEPWG